MSPPKCHGSEKAVSHCPHTRCPGAYVMFLGAQAMQILRGKLVGGSEAKEGAALSTWAHARAALVLRTEAVSVALRWVAGAKTIQVGMQG